MVAAALVRVVDVDANVVESVDADAFADVLVDADVDPPWGTLTFETPKTPLLLAVARAVLLRVGIVTASMALRQSAATLMVCVRLCEL